MASTLRQLFNIDTHIEAGKNSHLDWDEQYLRLNSVETA